jgi:hypothetical protein
VTTKKPTTKKKRTKIKFEDMTPDDIFAAWEAHARKALTRGQSYATQIFDPAGPTVKKYKIAITQHMNDTHEKFSAADYRHSTKVATDIGRLCSILAEADPNHVVSLDVFQRAAKLAELHPACPRTAAGSGRWCEV